MTKKVSFFRDKKTNFLWKCVEQLHSVDDLLFTAFTDFTSDDELVENCIHFVELQKEVELSDLSEVLIHNFDEEVDCLQNAELVVCCINAHAHEESGVWSVDDLIVLVLEDVCKVCSSSADESVNVCFQLFLLGGCVWCVPFNESDAALAIEDEEETNH